MEVNHVTQLIGKIGDRMLRVLAPKVDAQACTVTRVGCCDFCVCNYCCLPDGSCWCSRCSCQLC
jgi:hypothetical protein